MKDREFLSWLHARLEHIHGENPRSDVMHKLRGIVKAMPPSQESRPFSASIANEQVSSPRGLIYSPARRLKGGR